MSRKIYHVLPIGEAWGVRRERRKRCDFVYLFKADAVSRAKRLAKAAALGRVKVHGRNGRIQLEFSYKEDRQKMRG